jgi:HKD family nuclease
MKISILGQGYKADSDNSVGSQLIKLFSQKNFHTFTGFSAFTSPSAINGLSGYILNAKKHFKNITIITGVDKKGTSLEALESLRKLKIKTYIFYQKSSTIFHPKIYLFEGNENTELIIGSSNLTSQGLFTNVETSLLVSINNSLESDKKIIYQLKEYYKGIFDFDDPNLKKITKRLISELVKINIVPLEAERRAAYDKEDKIAKKETEKIIVKIFPKRAVAKMPKEFRGFGESKPKTQELIRTKEPMTTVLSELGKLVWRRKKLPSSSVQASGIGTNPTGGLRLVQDDFIYKGYKIDQTSYFRNILFKKFKWRQIRSTPYVEAALVPFEITIKSKFLGKFELEVRHKPSGEAGQHNYTTSISWGELSNIIREEKLTGKQLELYAPKGKNKPFHISIK